MRTKSCLALLLSLWFYTASSAQTNWSQFRGAGATGVVADDAKLPESWSQTENVAWATDIPGGGWSSPVIWGDHIFVTAVISSVAGEKPRKGLYLGGERPAAQGEHRWVVYCVDFNSGKIRWQQEVHKAVPSPTQSRHLKNSYASETPVTDGERLYAYFGNLGLFCFDMKGKLLWAKKFTAYKTRYGWGTAASPVLYQDRLYLVNDNEEQSFILALNKKTGEQIWRSDRKEGTNWATPYIWENDKRAEIITSGTDRVRSYALDGKLLWEFSGMSSIAIPTPFAKFGLLYIASGYVGDQHRPVYAIRSGASGDISLKPGEQSNRFISWYQPQAGPYNPSPIIYGDIYYTLYDRGFFTAHEARSGQEIYGKHRIDPATTAFTASPWAYNGKIFALSEDGDTFVIQAGKEFKVIGKNSLDEMCMATPAIARGSLIIRTASKLYRITRRK
ncbi:MAG: PQQ-binding-like beta-propeller repeat protein [Acidobacteria bacterium]|nr:PQQ-binding-like beta-propeller repeat protein [Acidobacteriota bacterium]